VVVGVVVVLVAAALVELDDEDPQPAASSAALTTRAPKTAGWRGPRIISFQALFASAQTRTLPARIASRGSAQHGAACTREIAARAGDLALSSIPVHFSELTLPEQRVLGCLIEKRWTTPDQYPLSLNALRLACNQSTNRAPVTDYDEQTVRDAAQRLSRYGLARLASGHSSRAIKYRHLAEEALSLGREQLAVLAVLLLRGPQTPGELKVRTERMARLASLADVERALDLLCERGHARRMQRRPGQKEERFEHLFGGASATEFPADLDPRVPERGAAPPAVPRIAEPPADGDLAGRISEREAEVSALREELSALRSGLAV